MESINSILMLVTADLYRRAGDASIVIRSGADERSFQVVGGNLISANSNVKAERLGDMLAGEHRLDPVLIEPVAAEARRRGALLGAQLIADGLLTPTEVASALERQARLRFEGALAMPGTVTLGDKQPASSTLRLSLGTAVVAVFRERLRFDSVQSVISDRDRPPLALDLTGPAFLQLGLAPIELRLARRLGAGETLEELLVGVNSPEPVVRLVGALVALGLWA